MSLLRYVGELEVQDEGLLEVVYTSVGIPDAERMTELGIAHGFSRFVAGFGKQNRSL